jgi:hypothetical protein
MLLHRTWPIAFNRDTGSSLSGALLTKSALQAIATGTAELVTWNTEVYDRGEWHSTVTNTGRLTIPSGVSLIRVISNAECTAEPNIRHQKNGADVTGMGFTDTLNTGNHYVNICSAPLAVVAGDYIETWLGITGGGDLNAAEETWFAIEELDETTKYALVTKTGTQSIGATTYTSLTFNSEIVDTDGFHDNVTNNTRLTVPAALDGKVVRLCANAAGGSVIDQLALRIVKNGVVTRGLPLRDSETSGVEFVNLASAPIIVATGDYFEVQAYFGTATTVPVEEYVWFSIEEVPAAIKRALVYKTGNQSINSGTYTILSWDAEVYDTDGLHDNVTNNSRLTVPAGCTLARTSFGIVGSNTTAQKFAHVLKNGAAYNGSPAFDTATTGADGVTGIGAWVDVAPGDYFEIEVLCNTASTVGTDSETWFCLECQ